MTSLLSRIATGLLALVLLAGCATQSGGADSAEGSSEEGWTFTTGYGETITLDRRPEVVVADLYSAASLWEYGIRPAAVFGYGLGPGASELSRGNVDLGATKVVGTDAELDLEALAALQPDLIIGYGNEAGTGWTWWDEDMTGKVTAIAPFAGVKFSGRPVPDVIAEYTDLAAALGADPESPEHRAPKAAYEKSIEELRSVTAERPELSTIALNADPSQLYLGTRGLSQLGLVADLGVELVGPGADDPESGWQELSWELVADHRADIVMAYAGSDQVFADSAAYRSLPAVKAGQIIEWDDKSPYTYLHYSEWLNRLVEAYRSADDVA